MKKPITDLFGIQAPATITVEVRDNAQHPIIPRCNPDYVFRRELLSDILAWLKGAAGNDPLYVVGPTGSGKSSVITQIASRLNIPLYVVSCHERLEIPELFGRFVVRNGSMEWADGPFISGLKDPCGAWILLDEADTLDPGAFVGLNAVNEGRTFIIPETGETIDPLRCGARVIFAGNTAGNGDATGLYQATKRQNLASMGRFMMLEVGTAGKSSSPPFPPTTSRRHSSPVATSIMRQPMSVIPTSVVIWAPGANSSKKSTSNSSSARTIPAAPIISGSLSPSSKIWTAVSGGRKASRCRS